MSSHAPVPGSAADPPGLETIRGTRARDPERPWYRYADLLVPSSPGRWVDLGCGCGEFLERTMRAHPLAGLDRSTTNARATRFRTGRSIVADLERPLPFADASLDGASLVEVIEHVTTAEALVDELTRVVRPGGWLIVTTPNVAHLTYRWRALSGHPPKQEGYHFRFFTRKTLQACFTARGFTLDARASFGKQALLSKLARLRAVDARHKVRYRVPAPLESLLAQHFVWRFLRDRSSFRSPS